jgi:hypothetical protein
LTFPNAIPHNKNNISIAKGAPRLFHSARWKAYLKALHDSEDNPRCDDADPDKIIYHIYHSQKIWFTRDEDNGHNKSALANLARCDALLAQCSAMVDDLEETLANTPKPSEVLDWARLW